jgi:hypothetical protein
MFRPACAHRLFCRPRRPNSECNQIQRWIERAMPAMAPILHAYAIRTKTLEAGQGPPEFSAEPDTLIFAIVDTGASSRSEPRRSAKQWTPKRPMFCRPARTRAAATGEAGKAGPPADCQAASLAALVKAHVFIRHLQVAVIDTVPIRPTDRRALSCSISRVGVGGGAARRLGG